MIKFLVKKSYLYMSNILSYNGIIFDKISYYNDFNLHIIEKLQKLKVA